MLYEGIGKDGSFESNLAINMKYLFMLWRVAYEGGVWVQWVQKIQINIRFFWAFLLWFFLFGLFTMFRHHYWNLWLNFITVFFFVKLSRPNRLAFKVISWSSNFSRSNTSKIFSFSLLTFSFSLDILFFVYCLRLWLFK